MTGFIIWLIVGLAACQTIDQIMCESGQFYRAKQSDTLTRDQLFQDLSGGLFVAGHRMTWDILAHKVYNLLAQTAEKNAPDPRLNGQSLNELIALNTWDTQSTCTKANYAARYAICSAFMPKRLMKDNYPYQRYWSETSSTQYNLGAYCWRVTIDIPDECRRALCVEAAEQLSSKKRVMEDFFNMAVTHVRVRGGGLMKTSMPQALCAVLEEMKRNSDTRQFELIKSTCNEVIEMFALPFTPRHKKVYIHETKGWTSYYEYCKIIEVLSFDGERQVQ